MADNDLEMFSYPTSYYSMRAGMAIEEKKLTYKKRLIMLPLLENHSSWYIKLNPQGQVPMLRHGKEYISDSSKIIAYLDANFGGTLLEPTEPKEAAETVQRFTKRIDALDIPVLTYGGCYHSEELLRNPQFVGFIINMMKGKVENNFLTKRLESELAAHPDMSHIYEPKIKTNKLVLERMKSKDAILEELERARSALRDVEDQLERVGFSPDSGTDSWLIGPDFTAADIKVAVFLGRMLMMGYGDALWEGGKLPLVSEYLKRLQGRPSYKKVVAGGYSKYALPGLLLGMVMYRVRPALPIVGVVTFGLIAYFVASKLYR